MSDNTRCSKSHSFLLHHLATCRPEISSVSSTEQYKQAQGKKFQRELMRCDIGWQRVTSSHVACTCAMAAGRDLL